STPCPLRDSVKLEAEWSTSSRYTPGRIRSLRRNSARTSESPGAFGVRYSCCSRTTDRKSTRLNSSHVAISYAVFCLKKKNTVPHRFMLRRILHSELLHGNRDVGLSSLEISVALSLVSSYRCAGYGRNGR